MLAGEKRSFRSPAVSETLSRKWTTVLVSAVRDRSDSRRSSSTEGSRCTSMAINLRKAQCGSVQELGGASTCSSSAAPAERFFEGERLPLKDLANRRAAPSGAAG